MRSFFWSVFSRNWTEYGNLLRKYPNSVQIQENTNQKKICVWTFFTQCICCNVTQCHCKFFLDTFRFTYEQKGLGVTLYADLKFVDHISRKNNATVMVNLIRRSFKFHTAALLSLLLLNFEKRFQKRLLIRKHITSL